MADTPSRDREDVQRSRFAYEFGKLVVAMGGNPDSAYSQRKLATFWERLHGRPIARLTRAFELQFTKMTKKASEGAELRFPTLPQFLAAYYQAEREERERVRREMMADGRTCEICNNTGVVSLYLASPNPEDADIPHDVWPSAYFTQHGRFVTYEYMLDANVRTYGQPYGFRCTCSASERALPRWAAYYADNLLVQGCPPARKEDVPTRH